jgi:hypothetical protein
MQRTAGAKTKISDNGGEETFAVATRLRGTTDLCVSHSAIYMILNMRVRYHRSVLFN